MDYIQNETYSVVDAWYKFMHCIEYIFHQPTTKLGRVLHWSSPSAAHQRKVKPSDPPKYFLTFQGIRNNGLQGASYVRSNLEAMLNVSTNRPKKLQFPDGEAPLPPVVTLPPEVFIAIADKAQRHKEMRCRRTVGPAASDTKHITPTRHVRHEWTPWQKTLKSITGPMLDGKTPAIICGNTSAGFIDMEVPVTINQPLYNKIILS